MIQPISGLANTAAGAVSSPSKEAGGNSEFLDTLRSAVDQVSGLQTDAQSQIANMLTGDGQDVHSTMIAVEKADLAFELMVQMRNKIVSAYQEISKIPF